MKKKLLGELLSVAIVASSIPVTAAAETYNPIVTAVFNGNTYSVFEENLNWYDAKEYCENIGGHLVTITSAAEQNFIEELIADCADRDYLIGLHRDFDDLQTWVTGETVDYENWGEGEPDDAFGGQEVGVIANGERRGGWYHVSKGEWDDVSSSGPFICEWDDYESADESAFTKDKDGWAIVNARESFGYPDGYRIPVSRYRKTFGISLSSLFLGGLRHIPEWGGNCFGLSILSIAQYNNQIDLTDYFPYRDADGLYNFGYNSIQNITKNSESGNIFSIADNDDAIETIECALISQNAQELKKAEVFAGDKKYGQLLKYLNSNDARPLLVTLNFGVGGHAMVITNDEKPVELTNSPGWYYIPLYDCNQPANSPLLKNPYKWYTQEDSYLLVDTNSGKWQYWRDGSAQHSGEYSFLLDKYIRFYDVSLLGEDFFNEALTLWGNIIKLDFSSNDISITDNMNNMLFKAVDGNIEYIDEKCDFSPSLDALNSDNILSGTLELPIEPFNCSINNGEIAVWSEQSLLSAAFSGATDITVDAENCSITNNSVSDNDLYISLQEDVTDDYAAISLSGKTEEGNTMSVSIDNGIVSSGGTENGTFDVKTETCERNREYDDLSLSEIDGMQIIGNDENKTSFGSDVSDWAKKEMEEAYNDNLIPNVLIGRDLTEKIDRAEFAAVSVQLYEELSGSKSSNSKNPFTDIRGNKCFDEILKAYDLGITAGTTVSTFEPDTLITREQLATMLCRTIKKYSFDGWSLDKDKEYYLDTSGVPVFADDSDISEFAKPSVYYMTKFGIIKGIDDTHFAPRNTTSAQEAIGYAMATREQAIALSLRIFKLSGIWE